MASTCSVTRMVPSSAAIEAPTLPPTTRALELRLRYGSQRLEARALAQEGEIHAAGRSVSLLGDDDLRFTVPLLGIGLVDLGPVDEEDHVRVLLDGARLAEVGEHGALV